MRKHNFTRLFAHREQIFLEKNETRLRSIRITINTFLAILPGVQKLVPNTVGRKLEIRCQITFVKFEFCKMTHKDSR